MSIISILAWIALAVTLSAAPKFGVVRVADIYRDLPSTGAMQKKMQEQRAAILTNTRVERFRTTLNELETLESQLRATKDDTNTEVRTKIVREFEIKRQEAETLRLAFEEYRAEEEKRINKEIVAATRESLGRISAAANQVAKERNLDGVFDVSGNSNTGVPVMLYVADSEDLTEDVIAFLDEKPIEDEEGVVPPEAADTETGAQPVEE